MTDMGRMFFFSSVLLLLFSACAKDKVANNNCPTTCPNVSFKAIIIPIFRANCAISGCHDVATSANKYVDLDSTHAYTSATQAGTGYVVAGNPSYSILLGQLYPGVANHMPNNGAQLDDCTIQDISCWIQQGALNN